MWGLGFGGWGLGFEVWGLGFWVWDVGSGVPGGGGGEGRGSPAGWVRRPSNVADAPRAVDSLRACSGSQMSWEWQVWAPRNTWCPVTPKRSVTAHAPRGVYATEMCAVWMSGHPEQKVPRDEVCSSSPTSRSTPRPSAATPHAVWCAPATVRWFSAPFYSRLLWNGVDRVILDKH